MTTSTKQVQPIRPNIKVTDTRYGLKTAARLAYERNQREQFKDSRRDALAKDRSKVQTKLESLRAEIRKLFAKLDTGVINGDGPITEALAKLERLGLTERKFESDIARITDKIGAIQ